MRRSAARRIAALAAIAIVAVAVVMLMSGGEDDYRVTAEFENASQLVTGNEVIVGGLSAGSVEKIELGPQGQALITFTVSEDYVPLPAETVATIRQGSLSSVAGRQLQLTLPPQGSDSQEVIEDGETMPRSQTVSSVDLDQIFNTLDTETVEDFKRVITGFRDSYTGVEKQANRGLTFLNPFLSTSRRVFSELNRDTSAFESLIVDTASLSGLLAERREDLTALVANASGALGAIGAERQALADAINQLPPFMRQANTTFVNLRAALDDLDPLVAASRPVARRLGPFFSELRAAAADAVPTVRRLDAVVSRPGRANDLVELTRLQVPLARAGVGSGLPDCGSDPSTDYEEAQDDDFSQGSLGEAVCALRNSNPQLSAFRAYTPELVGWFDGFSTSGTFDASGALGRIESTFNPFSLSSAGVPIIDLTDPPIPGVNPGFGAFDLRDELSGSGSLDVDNDSRCPGGLEGGPNRASGDASTPFEPPAKFDASGDRIAHAVACDEDEVPTGP